MTRTDRLAAFLWTRLSRDPNTWVITLARSVLALGTAATLVANDASILFHSFDVERSDVPQCGEYRALGAFCVLDGVPPDVLRLVLAGVLLVVATGVLPRVATPVQWYVTFSVFVNIVPMDGGDQIGTVVLFWLIAVTAFDDRIWGWRSGPRHRAPRYVVPNLVYLMVPLQVAVVYLNAGVAKMGSQPWAQGDAMWYWMQHPAFGAPDWLQPIALDVLARPWPVALLTWGTIVFELWLAVAVFVPSLRVRVVALVSGVVFHAGIALVIGLVSFGFAMTGSLLLAFVHPAEAERVRARLSRRTRRAASPVDAAGSERETDGAVFPSPNAPGEREAEPVLADAGPSGGGVGR